jgi:hypothetical protein
VQVFFCVPIFLNQAACYALPNVLFGCVLTQDIVHIAPNLPSRDQQQLRTLIGGILPSIQGSTFLFPQWPRSPRWRGAHVPIASVSVYHVMPSS